MNDRIELLGLMVDIASTKTASEGILQLLNGEGSNVVYFVSSETFILLRENQDWKMIVEGSDYVLPGNSNVNARLDDVLGHKRAPFFFDGLLDAVFDNAVEMGYEIFLVAEDEDKFTFIQENIHTKRPFLTMSGLFLEERDQSTDRIVNEINSVAPNILLIALEETKQLELLQQFRKQMNAGIMLFTGNVLYNNAVSDVEVPDSIQKLRIENLYKWFLKERSWKSMLNNLRMKLGVRRKKKEN